MKKILALSIFCFTLVACNQPKASSETEKEIRQDTVKQENKTVKKDKTASKYTKEELAPYFTEKESELQTLVQPKGITPNTNGLYCYFLVRNGGKATGLRFHIQYWSDKYSNVHYYNYNVDGKTFSYVANRNKSGASDPRFGVSTFYWYDDDVNRTDLKFLNAVAKGKNATVSLIEKGTNEVIETLTISEEEKLSVYRTLEYYYALNGALIPKKGMVNIRR